MKSVNNKKDTRQPVVRLRMILIGLSALIAFMSIPLLLVWKQSYINQTSLRLENRADTLRALNGQITSLKLESGRLSAPARVERLAMARGFEYPSSNSMEVLAVGPSGAWSGGALGGFFARVTRAILDEKG